MKAFAPLVALAALAVPALALAAVDDAAAPPQGDVAAIHVTGRGLDLSRPHDASVMLQRISTAALQACGASDFSIPEYRRSVLNSACYRASVDQAVRQLDAPGVNALYGQDSGQPAVMAGAE